LAWVGADNPGTFAELRKDNGRGGKSMSTSASDAPADLADLRQISARLGANPLLIQGPGGNTSVKQDEAMWIKASGTLLAEANDRNIFVEVDLPELNKAIERADPKADEPGEFARIPGGLRPSIETSLHAVFPHRVVLHVHCVNTIALAVREDATERLAERLGAFDWAFVPYAKPGARLAASTAQARSLTTNVIVLGNHGLIVAGESATKAAELLDAVVSEVRATPAPETAPDLERLSVVAGDSFAPAPSGHPLHTVARSPVRLAAATGGSLYPDHVIFCGAGAIALQDEENADALVTRLRELGLTVPPFLLVTGAGALLRKDAGLGARALARCLGDVLTRIPEGAPLNYLTEGQTRELIDWDAEKYRQAINAH
jgi:rhamnose utilization protein RhaD (predicted bifunctional aldolase and dehydrogenase)